MQKCDFRVDLYAAKSIGLSQLFAKAKRFAIWFGKCIRQKGFSASKMCRGRKKIIGILHSKINTRFDKMAYKIFNEWQMIMIMVMIYLTSITWEVVAQSSEPRVMYKTLKMGGQTKMLA